MQPKFKIIVTDDHQLFRKGVLAVLSNIDYVEVAGEASNGLELLKLLESTQTDAILMDIKMPHMDGIETTQEVVKRYPHIRVVALSMFGDEVYLENMINAGAQGFILKNANADDLELAIKTISEGKQYYSEEFISYFTNKYMTSKATKEEPKLSKREMEVLQLLGKGLTSGEIAEKLFISENTVSNHRASLNSKTGSKNTVSLLAYAIKHNLVDVDTA